MRVLAVSLLLMLVCVAPAAAQPANVLSGQVTGEQVRSALEQSGSVTVTDAVVTGEVRLPAATRIVKIERSELLGGIAIEDTAHARFDLRDVKVGGAIDFDSASIAYFKCENCTFAAPVDMQGIDVLGSLEFHRCVFEDRLKLMRGRAAYIRLSESDLRRGALAWGLTSSSWSLGQLSAGEPISMEWQAFGHWWLYDETKWSQEGQASEGREAQLEGELRFWRQNFDALGRRDDSRAVDRELMEFRQDHVLTGVSAERVALWSLGWISGYGTSPYRPLWISFFVILLFVVIYYWIGFTPAAEKRKRRIALALRCSVDTFVPLLPVTGFKDSGHVVDDRYWLVVTTERVLGVLLTMLAIYSVAVYVL